MILEVKNLGLDRGEEVHLRNISFSLEPCECLVIRTPILLLGTALLETLMGLEEKVSGEVLFGGENMLDDMPSHRRLSLRRDIGYAHRVGGLVSLLNVRENIALPLCYHAKVTRGQAAFATDEVAEATGIRELLDREVDELDMVQMRLVNLARALINRPRLLLVDAILEGMKDEQRERVSSAIGYFRGECDFGVLMTTRTRDLPQTTRVLELRPDGLCAPGNLNDA